MTISSSAVSPGDQATATQYNDLRNDILIQSTATTLDSDSTVNIGASTSHYINITGTTTINAFDTITAGTRRILKFDGSLTLTYNATSMILPGNANIATAAGDIAEFVSLGSGNWICTYYTKKSGYVAKSGDETINGVKTFGDFIVTPSSDPSSDYEVANKKYVDGFVGIKNIFSYDFSDNGRISKVTVGGSLAFSTYGCQISNSATSGQYAQIYLIILQSYKSQTIDANFTGFIALRALATGCEFYLILSSSGSPASSHFGFKISESGGVYTLYGHNYDTAENNVVMTTVSINDELDLYCKKTTSGFDYYYRKNGGTLQGPFSNNSQIPTGNCSYIIAKTNNNGGGGVSTIECGGVCFSR